MKTEKKAVIFDNEWVIVKNDWDSVASKVAADYGIPLMSGSDYKKALQGDPTNKNNRLYQRNKGLMGKVEFWGSVLQDHGLPTTPEDVDRISGALEGLTTEADPGVVALIGDLRDTKYRTFLLSNATPEIEAGNRRRYDYFELFDKTYFSHNIGFRKPDPRAYQVVLSDNGLEPDECIFVDDKRVNVEAARSLGIGTIMFKLGISSVDDLIKELALRGVTVRNND